MTATRKVTGQREKVLSVIDSISPRSRDAVTINLGPVSLEGLVTYSIVGAGAQPAGKLTLQRGTLSAVVKPVMGERASKPGVFDISTPVSSLTDVVLTNAEVTLEAQGKRFNVAVPSARLSAFNGSYNGSSNALQGAVTVGGTVVTLPPGFKLDPAFEQATFDTNYLCTDDLKGVVTP